MRNVYFIAAALFCALSIGYLSMLFGADSSEKKPVSSLYSVEIAEYKYPVYTNYFEKIEGVFELNTDDSYHYFVGLTKSYSHAEKIKSNVFAKGYKKAAVVDLEKKFTEDQIKILQENYKSRSEKKQKLISKLSNVDNQQFYSICVKVDTLLLGVDQFSNPNTKVHQQGKKYFYVQGRFSHANDAKKMMKSLSKDAKLAFFNDGKISFSKYTSEKVSSKVPIVKKKEKANPVKKSSANTTKNISQNTTKKVRKWTSPQIKRKGKVYVDYYYDTAGELINGDTKLMELKKKGIEIYVIQIFASKENMEASCFRLKTVKSTYDKEEKIYRYFYGNFDNYWVCRRKLRDVRLNGYPDAFIVKL